MNILRNSKALQEDEISLSEDFCANTKEDRKLLKSELSKAKGILKTSIAESTIRYKSILIKRDDGQRFNFYVEKVRNNPNWWRAVGGTHDEVIPEQHPSQEEHIGIPEPVVAPEDPFAVPENIEDTRKPDESAPSTANHAPGEDSG